MQIYHVLEAKTSDLDQEKRNEKCMSTHPKKEEEARKRIFGLDGYCQENFFRASQNALSKRLGEQLTNFEKNGPNKQTVPTSSWLREKAKSATREIEIANIVNPGRGNCATAGVRIF